MPGRVTIALDGNERVAPGDIVRGVARLEVDEPGIDLFEVRLEHAAEARDRRGAETLVEAAISAGPFTPAGALELPFTFVMPAGPRPYEGELFRTELRVVAEARGAVVRHGLRPRAEVTLALDAEPPRTFAIEPVEDTNAADLGRTFLKALGVSALGALGVVASALTDFGLFAVIGVIAILLSGALILLTFGRWRAERRTGDVTVTLKQVEGGDYRSSGAPRALRCGVRSSARHASASASLTVSEGIPPSPGSDISRSRDAHVVRVELEEREPGCFEGQIELPDPALAPAPFDVERLRVRWSASVRIEVPGAPAWEQHYPLEVSALP